MIKLKVSYPRGNNLMDFTLEFPVVPRIGENIILDDDFEQLETGIDIKYLIVTEVAYDTKEPEVVKLFCEPKYQF